MGIDTQIACQLIALRSFLADRGPGVMLGRQGLALKPALRGHVRRALKAEGLDANVPNYIQPDGFAETFLKKIGLPEMQSLDASPYEGADFVHDLNRPVPTELRDRFGLILDGGTLEHVFNAPRALDNVFHMLRPGGVFVSINGITGWAGHGFYQFSPELTWRYWKDARRCKVHRCAALPYVPGSAEPRESTDTGGNKGRRFKGKGMEGRWYLFYVVERTPDAVIAESITHLAQGDYAHRWDASDMA